MKIIEGFTLKNLHINFSGARSSGVERQPFKLGVGGSNPPGLTLRRAPLGHSTELSRSPQCKLGGAKNVVPEDEKFTLSKVEGNPPGLTESNSALQSFDEGQVRLGFFCFSGRKV